jgi:hypothetical protein
MLRPTSRRYEPSVPPGVGRDINFLANYTGPNLSVNFAVNSDDFGGCSSKLGFNHKMLWQVGMALTDGPTPDPSRD